MQLFHWKNNCKRAKVGIYMSNGHITFYNYMFLDQSPQEDIILPVIFDFFDR